MPPSSTPTSRSTVLLQQALQHHQAGRLTAAAALYVNLRQLEPKQFDGYHLGGTAALQLGKLEPAVALLQRAIQLRPSSGVTHMCLGLALGQLGRSADAEKYLSESTRLDPQNVETWFNFASLLVVIGKLDEAGKIYRHGLKLRPDHAASWSGLGSLLQIQARYRESFDHQTRALALDPKHPTAQSCRGQALLNLHQTDAALRDFEAHLVRQPNDLEAQSSRLFLLNYLPDFSRERLFEEHRTFGQRLARINLGRARKEFSNSRDPAKRLRIAFFSPDLREHSVSFFIEPILRELNKEKYEVFLYHNHSRTDHVSRRLQTYATQWRNLIGLADSVADAQIRQDAPDVLIDLAGHSGFSRMPLIGERLAPVQVTYLGYPNTTGLTTMDYRLTDRVADPEGESDTFHTERLLRFAETAWAYQPPTYAPVVSETPPSLRGQPFTFGSFNNLAKLSAPTLLLWAEILRSVPSSRLLIKGHSLDEQDLRLRTRTAGIDDARLLILQPCGLPADHLACYDQVDVALDSSPYSGTTTTCEALWMGVPVITLLGDRHASRVSASLVSAIGHREWIAADSADYIRIAQRLAADPSALAALRAGLRDEVRKSPLLDHPGQTRCFEKALRQIWRGHCGLAPLGFSPEEKVMQLPKATY